MGGQIYEKMGTKLIHLGDCPKCNAPTHVVTVEVRFTVEIDVRAGSDEEAEKLAVEKVQSKYDKDLKSAMAETPKRIDVDASWTDEYETENSPVHS
jgi:hypothetical protein